MMNTLASILKLAAIRLSLSRTWPIRPDGGGTRTVRGGWETGLISESNQGRRQPGGVLVLLEEPWSRFADNPSVGSVLHYHSPV